MKIFNHISYKPLAKLFFLLLSFTAAHSQTSTGNLEEKFGKYAEHAIQEKLYMHIDRNFYLAGDILWCKLYIVDASLHQPLDISKVAYIEVLDTNNTPALQAKISLQNGKGNGSLSLPISIKSGNYKIRAYTNWMKNAGPDYFFEKMITIVNTQKNRELPSPVISTNTTPDIRFFPEGGNLVSGIHSRIACKVQGVDGKGLAFSGNIVDENNTTVANFQSLKFGMGSFEFTPAAGHTYKVVVEAGQNKITKKLPEIYPQGYVMQVNTSANKTLSISVQTNLTDTGKLFLLAHTRQSLKTVLQASIQNGKAVFNLEEGKLGEGISQLTVITSAGKPVCERLYFKYPSQNLDIHIKGNESIYTTRSKIDLDIEPLVQNSKQPATDLSVAVYRLDELQSLDETNIQTFLWLSSDLKGLIESPAYYFEKRTDEILAAMDNLMLTQGWRRFAWDDILQERTPAVLFPPEMNGHIITGKVISTVTGKPLENIETYVSVPGLNANFRASISDATGKVKFDFKNMNGSSEIIVQTNPAADTLSHVELNNPFFEQYTPIQVAPFRLSVAKEKALLDQSIGIQVQHLYAGNQLKRFIQSGDSLSLFKKPDALYMMDDYTRFTTIEEVLREYVTLMDVQKNKGRFSLQLIDNYEGPRLLSANKLFFQLDPMILVDGVPIFNVDRLMSYDPLKMRKLEVYNRRYFQDNSFFSGILNWTSYKGDLANFELDPRALVIDYEGLQLQREFYSPVYDSPGALSHTPDFRTLLYWSHEINPDKNGDRHVRFFTSDKKGKYVAVFQGLTNSGQCGSTVLPFEVR
jgi:hypothetical protein